MIRPIGQRVARLDVPDSQLFVPNDSLLIAANGQTNEGSLFGRIELATFFSHNSGITGHIMRVLPRTGQRDAIYAFLATAVGQLLLKSTAVGTSVPTMRVDLLEDLPFPDPARLPLQDLSHAIRDAEQARLDAARAEDEAIGIIEHEVVPQWLV
jgi:hypothetical protein